MNRLITLTAGTLLVVLPLIVVGLWITTNISFDERIKALETQVGRNVETLRRGQLDRYTARDAQRDLAEVHDRLEKLENGT